MFSNLSEIVVDTNVFVHAYNPSNQYNQNSIEVLNAILNSSVSLCVDGDYDSGGAGNRSRLGNEYNEHITPGQLGYAVLLTVLDQQRLKSIPVTDVNLHKKHFRQMVSNTSDVIVLSTAMCSADKFLISNDYTDFTQRKRAGWRKRPLFLTVKNANEMVR